MRKYNFYSSYMLSWKRLICIFLISWIFFLPDPLFSQCPPHSIFTPDNEERIYACAADGKPDNFIFTKSDTSNQKYAYVLADGGDNVIRVQTSSNFNFDGPIPAIFRVWGISYSDSITFRVGQDVTLIRAVSGCARLSENVIQVLRDVPTGADAFFLNEDRDTIICASNNKFDTLIMKNPGIFNSKQIFIVTRFNGAIIDFFNGFQYIVDGLGKGSYFIYSVSYTGNLTIAPNNNIFTTNLSNGCFAVGLRPARIDLQDILPSTMVPESNQTIFCPKDKLDDPYLVQLDGGQSPLNALVLLNNEKICTDLVKSSMINFNIYDEGEYTLQSLSYSGKLLIKIGDTIIKNSPKLYSSDCFAWSTNTINIKLLSPKAGQISSSTGDTLLFACPGDRLPDRITFVASGHSSTNYVVVIINEKSKIVALTSNGGFVDFEGFPPGTCKAYGIAYTGFLSIDLDSTFLTNAVLSTDCYNVSSNFLIIIKDMAKGGTISLKGGATTYYSCPDKDGPRKIEFERRNNSISPYQYVLTSESGSIIDFVQNDSLAFSNLNAQAYRIYGVAFSGRRVISKLSNLFVSSFSDGCYSISDNFIRVVHERPRGGGIRLPDGSNKELFCPSETGSRLVQFRNVDVSSVLYNFVITDSTFKIIEITPRFSFNFDPLPKGLYFVYGVSYIGNIVLLKGNTLDFSLFSDECFSFSGVKIDVIIGEINGGRLTSSEGSANVFTCPSNVDPDLIQIIPINTRALSYRYILANEQNIIVGFSSVDMIDFGSAAINSKCRVYGVAYKGDFTGVLNRDVFQTAYSMGCYDLSDNFVFIRKLIPPNHRIITSLRDSVVTLCIGDSQKDTIKTSTSDTTGFKTAYLGVENGKIIKVVTTSAIEFEKDSAGILKLYSLIYTGRLLATPGLNLVAGLALSDDCFSLSSNFYVIDKVKQGPFCVITSTRDESWIFSLKVYPNPSRVSSKGTIHIEWVVSPALIHQTAHISIIDLQGHVLYSKSQKLQSINDVALEARLLAPGMVFLKIQSGDKIATRKVMIQL